MKELVIHLWKLWLCKLPSLEALRWVWDTTVITELAEYFEKGNRIEIPPMTPFVGKNFNVTRAGIHADGILKNEEIYNIFNTDLLLNRPVQIAVSKTSGLAGIAYWVNNYFNFKGDKALG